MKTIVAAALLMLLSATGLPAQPKTDYKKKGAPIPSFVLEQIDGRLLTNAVLKPGAPVLFIIFSPQCEHCAKALDSLTGMRERFKKTQVILLTEALNKPYLKDFLEKHNYAAQPLFKYVGLDRSNLVYSLYTYGLLPQFNIYSAKHKLVKSFTGIFPMDSLKMVLP